MSPEMIQKAAEIAIKQVNRLIIKYGPELGEKIITALEVAAGAIALGCRDKNENDARLIARAIIADINQGLTESQDAYEHEFDKERNCNGPSRA